MLAHRSIFSSGVKTLRISSNLASARSIVTQDIMDSKLMKSKSLVVFLNIRVSSVRFHLWRRCSSSVTMSAVEVLLS